MEGSGSESLCRVTQRVLKTEKKLFVMGVEVSFEE